MNETELRLQCVQLAQGNLERADEIYSFVKGHTPYPDQEPKQAPRVDGISRPDRHDQEYQNLMRMMG